MLRTAARIQALVAICFALAALALRGPLTDELFSGSETLYWIYVGAVLAFAASFFARGFLAGEGHFGVLAGLLTSESFSRMLFSLAVAVGIAAGRDAIAAGVVAAPLFSLTVVPLAFVHRATRAAGTDPAPAAAPRARDTGLAGGGAFAAAVLLIMLSEQIFLNAGPLLLHASVSAAAAGYIFNVLMLARAPLLVFQGIAISLLPHLTRLRSRRGDDPEAAEAFELSVGVTLRAIVVFTAVVALVVAIAGPALMQAAFSDRFSYDRAGLLIVTAAMGLYLASTTLNQAALAQGQARRAATCWIACAVGFLVWSLIDVLDPARRIEVGFLAAAAVLFLALRRLYRERRDGDELEPRAGGRGAACTGRRSQLITGYGRRGVRFRADPRRRAVAGRGARRRQGRRSSPNPRPAALPGPRDADRVRGHRRRRLQQLRAGPHAGDDRPRR